MGKYKLVRLTKGKRAAFDFLPIAWKLYWLICECRKASEMEVGEERRMDPSPSLLLLKAASEFDMATAQAILTLRKQLLSAISENKVEVS